MPLLAVNGTELYYERAGLGPPCVVLHGGLGVDQTIYRTLPADGAEVLGSVPADYAAVADGIRRLLPWYLHRRDVGEVEELIADARGGRQPRRLHVAAAIPAGSWVPCWFRSQK